MSSKDVRLFFYSHWTEPKKKLNFQPINPLTDDPDKKIGMSGLTLLQESHIQLMK